MFSKKDLLEESMKRLGWEEVCSILSRFASSEAGVEECLNLRPFPDFESACAASRASAEMAELLCAKPSVPSCGFKNIEPLLSKASKGTVLDLKELKMALDFVRLQENMINYFNKKSPDTIPHLLPLVQSLLPIPDFLGALEGILSDEGGVRENASPGLSKLCKRTHSLRSSLTEKMEKILDSSPYSPHLQDRYYTERENRYVIPIKVEDRSKCRGIVHGISGSGSTLFLEPEEVVDLNNHLKVNELSIQREIARILQESTSHVVLHKEALRSNLRILTRIDVLQAVARFGKEFQASHAELTRGGGMVLKNAKHPVLWDEKGNGVMGNTLEIAPHVFGIVISGPNTGGKTVTLKMVGLFALMAAAGLPLPVEEGSIIPYYSSVYADIGDEQSIHLNLSTFSAHLVNIIRMMESAEPCSLVLLDELMISTEPVEGSALAESIFLYFVEKKVRVMVTTHYNSLKILGKTREDCLNIGFGFDLEGMAPTYRLVQGLPEKSSPMKIALRLGMKKEITDRALGLLGDADRRLEDFLSRLGEERRALEKERTEANVLRKDLEVMESDRKRLLEEIRVEKEDFAREKRKRLTREVAGAKREIWEMVESLKRGPSKKTAKEVEGRLRSFLRPEKDPSNAVCQIPWESLQPGDILEIPDLEAKGELLELPGGRKTVRVKIGNFESTVKISLIKGFEKRSRDAEKEALEGKTASSIRLDPSYSRPLNQECDLRGVAGDEAVNILAGFLDAAILGKLPSLRIIHGIGKGILKNRVVDFLSHYPGSLKFRPGFPQEGGEGVTVVEFE